MGSLIHCGILVLVEAAILLLLLDDDEGMPSMLFDFDTRIKKENPCYSDEASQSDCPILRCFLSFAAENEGHRSCEIYASYDVYLRQSASERSYS